MKGRKVLLAAVAAGGIAITAAGPAIAQDTQSGMGHGMMQGGMDHAMMQGGMDHAMMCPGMMAPGMGAPFGKRVLPVMNLSVDDVRNYLAWRLEQIGNERLKVGAVKADDGTITADIATVDNSLVQRLKIDRRTGAINYEN